MIKESIGLDETIELLNELVKLDAIWLRNIIDTRLLCSESLANHPTIQAGGWGPDHFFAGPLGLINGLFGVDELDIGPIAAVYQNGALIGFRRTATKENDEKNELSHVSIDWGALGGDAAIVTNWDGREWKLHKLPPKES